MRFARRCNASSTHTAFFTFPLLTDSIWVALRSQGDVAMYMALGNGEPPSLTYRLPWELKRQILGLRGTDWAPIVLGHYQRPTSPSQCQALQDAWERNLSTYCDRVQACPGAAELVEQLAAAGIPMAIATSSRQSSVAKKRKNHEAMFQQFGAIVCGDQVSNGKPAPDIYIKAAQELGVDANECLVVEDALTGVRAGKAAGCTVMAVPDNRFDAEELKVFQSEAHVVLSSLWDFSGAMFGIEGVEMKRPEN